MAEVRASWPRELDDWLASPDVAPPGGESFADVERRVRRARNHLISAYPAGTVVVVSHVTPVKTLLRLALEAPPAAMFRIHLDASSISIADYYADSQTSVRLVNDTGHLQSR
jgi:probable phosphoglycerate mutase